MQPNKIRVQEIIDRMKKVLGYSTDAQLANHFGLSITTPGGWKHRGTIPIYECMGIAHDHSVSLDWLILGIGTKEAPTVNILGSAPAVSGAGDIVMEGVGEVAGFVDLPVLDMATFSTSSKVGAWKVPQNWLDANGLTAADTALVVAAGDPMIPSIQEGQMVVVDRRPRDTDGVFLLRFVDSDTVRFKRVQRVWDGSLRLSNDNPAYAVDVVPRDQADRIEFMGYCHATWQSVR